MRETSFSSSTPKQLSFDAEVTLESGVTLEAGVTLEDEVTLEVEVTLGVEAGSGDTFALKADVGSGDEVCRRV